MTTLSLDIAEVHTSDLTEACMRRTYHRRRDEQDPEATTALCRGLMAGECLRYLHLNGMGDIDGAMLFGERALLIQLEQEGRHPSDAVKKNWDKLTAEVRSAVELYAQRFGPRFDRCELIGCEIPIRWTYEPEWGEPIELASHLDLIYRDTENVFLHGEGKLWVPDWKWRDKSPTSDYLARNLQFALYWLMVRYGSIQTDEDLDIWVELGEWPQMAWIHLPHLEPYKRATPRTDRLTGEVIQYKKGDARPDSTVMQPVYFHPDNEASILAELEMRRAMFAAGHYPINPDPVGCNICPSEKHCKRWDMNA